MKKRSFIVLGLVLMFFLNTNAQEYCLKFSKQSKRTTLIKQGRNIAFVLSNTEKWGKGKLVQISSDSLFIEQPIAKKDILTERESSCKTTGYKLSDFKVIAYNNTAKTVGKGSAAVLITLIAIIGGGVELGNAYFDDGESNAPPKKFFKKNVDLDKGWKAEIVLCE
ncbi:MAG: hypothetical protein ACPGSL_10215 [Vicingaceae bacterium]